MKLSKTGKVIVRGIEFDNPLDRPVSKRNYREWKEGTRTSFKAIWLDRYVYDATSVSYEAWELKMSNRGKCFLDDKEVKDKEEIETVKEIFNSIRLE